VAVLTTGAVSAMVTNDVALLLVVPFTLAFEKVAPGFDPIRVVILEIQAANLLGCITPTGNPQNLLLFSRGGFTTSSFLAAQLPWVAGMALATLAFVPFLVPRRPLPAPPAVERPVEPLLATAGLFLLSLQLLAISQAIPRLVPLVAALPAAALLGKGLLKTDFTLLGVFSALFVGVEGLRRSAIFDALDPSVLFGATPAGFVLAGALLSQVVSNVPAAILLAPAAAGAGGGALFTGLLYGVNAGGCGTPIASLANLIGADLYLRGRVHHAPFWRLFLAVSFALLAVAIALSLLATGPGRGGPR
jgi:Na+/H+ antiporter NhaD/arsenite permease-like protein